MRDTRKRIKARTVTHDEFLDEHIATENEEIIAETVDHLEIETGDEPSVVECRRSHIDAEAQ